MTENLIKAVEALGLADKSSLNSCEESDAFLQSHRPRKRKKTSLKDIKHKLESTFLQPNTDFSAFWLNQLQQWVQLSVTS